VYVGSEVLGCSVGSFEGGKLGTAVGNGVASGDKVFVGTLVGDLEGLCVGT